MDCPQCGHLCFEFCEGVCSDCCEANQRALDEHNAQFDAWEKMTDQQRDEAIRRAIK